MIQEIKDEDTMDVMAFEPTFELYKNPTLETVCGQLGVNYIDTN